MTAKIKLTKAMRDGFVIAVLNDIDSGLDLDAINKLVMQEALAALPPAVLALYQDEKTRQYVQQVSTGHTTVYRATKPGEFRRYVNSPNVWVPGPGNYSASEKTMEKVKKILQAHADKMDEKEAMGERLTAMAGACKNTEELEDMFPLLTKYIPKPVIVPRSMVPAVQIKDTMKDLRRLGVPPKAVAVAA